MAFVRFFQPSNPAKGLVMLAASGCFVAASAHRVKADLYACFKDARTPTCVSGCTTHCAPDWVDATSGGMWLPTHNWTCVPCRNYSDTFPAACESVWEGYVPGCTTSVQGQCCFRNKEDIGIINTILPCKGVPGVSTGPSCGSPPNQ